VPRHRAGVLQYLIGIAQRYFQQGANIIMMNVKTLSSITEPPTSSPPEILEPTLEPWKRAITDLPHKLYEGLTGLGSFLNDAFSSFADSVATSMTTGLLSFFQVFINFLDTIIENWLGIEGAVTQLLTNIVSFFAWVASSFSYAVNLLTEFFLLAAESLGNFLSTVGTVLSGWVTVFDRLWYVLETGFAGGISIYEMYIGPWLPLLPIAIVLYEVYRLDTGGVEAVYSDITFMINIFMFIFNAFITVLTFFINLMSSLIESIPIME